MASDSEAKKYRQSSTTDDGSVFAGPHDSIPEPEPAYIPDGIPDDEREAQELHAIAPEQSRISRVLSPVSSEVAWYTPIKKFWRHHVRISVPHVDCRDHLANERTFLGYLRTSVALSMLGVITAQLYRLQHSPTPSPTFGYFVLSKPISAIFQSSALGMVLLGAIRYYRQQGAMARGKALAGGWEIFVIVGFMTPLMFAMFALHIALDVTKQMSTVTFIEMMMNHHIDDRSKRAAQCGFSMSSGLAGLGDIAGGGTAQQDDGPS